MIKYQPKVSIEIKSQYLDDILIDSSFKEVNRFLILLFESENDRTVHTKYYLHSVEVKEYNVWFMERSFFNHPVRNSMKTYFNIRKIATGQGDDYKTGWLLDYNYFKEYMIAITFSKQQTLDVDPKAMQ